METLDLFLKYIVVPVVAFVGMLHRQLQAHHTDIEVLKATAAAQVVDGAPLSRNNKKKGCCGQGRADRHLRDAVVHTYHGGRRRTAHQDDFLHLGKFQQVKVR